MSLIELRNVSKSFGDNHVLVDANLQIKQGESLIILGRSGIGKSVTLLIITGLMRPDEGQVLVNGQDITRMAEKDLISLRRKFSYVFQSGALFDSLTVYDNVAFPLMEDPEYSPERIEEVVYPILERLQLDKIADQMPDEISTGMKKRVAIARAIAASPKAILYDEPTTGVDTITGKLISRMIRELNKELGVTSIVVTHDLKCAQIVADSVAFLHDGCFYFHGSFKQFLETDETVLYNFKHSMPYMMTYIGGQE